MSRARLRTGRELTVINISTSGVLVEGLTRLLPGTRAEIHIATRHGRVLVRTRVIRSLVWRLEPDIVWYRAALAFEMDVDTEAAGESGSALSERGESKGHGLPAAFPGNVEGPGTDYPNGDAGVSV